MDAFDKYRNSMYILQEAFQHGAGFAKNDQPEWRNPYSDLDFSDDLCFKKFMAWYAGWCFQMNERYTKEKKRRDKIEHEAWLNGIR